MTQLSVGLYPHLAMPHADVQRQAPLSASRFAAGSTTVAALQGGLHLGVPAPAEPQAKVVAQTLRLGRNLLDSLLHLRGFQHRYVATGVGVIHAIDARGHGPLPTMVLLPGLASDVTDYARLLWRLVPHCTRVIALDLPCHGKSHLCGRPSRAHFNQSIQRGIDTLVGPQPIIVIGHSLGGYAAMRYALTRPQRVRAMVLVAPAGGPLSQAARLRFLDLFSSPDDQRARAIVRRTQSASQRESAFAAQAIRARLLQPALQGLVHSDLMYMAVTPAELARLPGHLLLVWAGGEGLLPPAHLRYFAVNLPPSRRVLVPPGLAHSTFALGPRDLTKTVTDFLHATVVAPATQVR